MRFAHFAGAGGLAGLLALTATLGVRAQDATAKQDTATQGTANTKQDPVAPGTTKQNAGDLPGSDQIKERLGRDEYEAAWVRLFDGTTTLGWEPRGAEGWTIADQTLQCVDKAATFATKTEFADFEFAGECQVENGGSATISLRAPTSGDITNANAAQVRFLSGGGRAAARAGTYLLPNAQWKPFYITLDGGKLIHSPDAKGQKSQLESASWRGVIALTASGKGTVRFRNLKLRARNFKTIFNGKDLTGWTPVEGHQSVFSVTPEGFLNIKNGNGDIQSAGQYGDFAFSVDVYSNGDHLNSGVFFREIPGQFWAGYEDQIRNQWQGDDRTKAVDYGTGGVYNRQPARKVVSTDREWFTMTLFVSGTHIASFVDGYQVADFTDTRAATADNNARSGVRTLPGCIGLQGHDPTTDLSFRNIRIVEMPAAKAANGAPKSAATTNAKQPARDVSVSLKMNNGVYLNASPTTMDHLEGALRALYAEASSAGVQPRLVVTSDANVAYGRVAAVIDAARRVGYTQVSLPTNRN